MKRLFLLLCAVLLATPTFAQTQRPRAAQMEIVFVVDTTGSMGGLIAGAKKKIWSIVNEIVMAKPQPTIKIGFVAYRDKGDDYVTQVHPLTADLDAAFATLSKFQADGGGDLPEHVNAGLHDAVTKLNWSAGGSDAHSLYQVIFLVGDCPPHMDYNDGLDYQTDVAKAASRGIFVNAIRCGDNAETQKLWIDIAKRGQGSYFSLAQDGGTTDIATPYDSEMIRLSAALEKTTVARRGMEGVQAASSDRAKDLAGAPAERENALNRAAFASKSAQVYGKFDITTEIANGRKVSDFKKDEWPDALQKMTPAQRAAYLNAKVAQRKQVQSQMALLEHKRAAYIRQQLAKTNNKNGFDQKMLGTFKSQAARRGFVYR